MSPQLGLGLGRLQKEEMTWRKRRAKGRGRVSLITVARPSQCKCSGITHTSCGLIQSLHACRVRWGPHMRPQIQWCRCRDTDTNTVRDTNTDTDTDTDVPLTALSNLCLTAERVQPCSACGYQSKCWAGSLRIRSHNHVSVQRLEKGEGGEKG